MYSGFEITFILSQARIYSGRKSFIHLENLWLEVTVNFLSFFYHFSPSSDNHFQGTKHFSWPYTFLDQSSEALGYTELVFGMLKEAFSSCKEENFTALVLALQRIFDLGSLTSGLQIQVTSVFEVVFQCLGMSPTSDTRIRAWVLLWMFFDDDRVPITYSTSNSFHKPNYTGWPPWF